MPRLRIGHGYDIHRIVPARPLILGGVKFETDYGLEGHSDADALTHAICDALLGAAGLPDTQVLLRRVVAELRDRGYNIVNLDATVIAEKPRIYGRIAEMKAALALSAGLSSEFIGLKATTNEGVGDLGRGLAIAAHAVALIEKT
jgi:2-C-methyl-D-erythritol 2,4-cyclodiphosphate synthase